MNKVTTILSLPIAEIATGKYMGQASDLIYDFQKQELYLVLKSTKRGLDALLKTSDIKDVGADYLLIEEETRIRQVIQNPEILQIFGAGYVLLGVDVVSIKGTRIGKIEDIILSDDNTQIESLVLDTGEEIEGTSIVSVSDQMIFVKKGADDGRVHLKKTVTPVKEEMPETDSSPRGLILKQDVVSEDEMFHVEAGTVITDEILKEAEEHEALLQLAMYAGE